MELTSSMGSIGSIIGVIKGDTGRGVWTVAHIWTHRCIISSRPRLEQDLPLVSRV